MNISPDNLKYVGFSETISRTTNPDCSVAVSYSWGHNINSRAITVKWYNDRFYLWFAYAPDDSKPWEYNTVLIRHFQTVEQIEELYLILTGDLLKLIPV